MHEPEHNAERVTIEIGAEELDALERERKMATRMAFIAGWASGALTVLLIESFFI